MYVCIKFRFFQLLIPQKYALSNIYQPFFIIFLLSKANFGINNYTENIHKIPTPRNRAKDYSRILPERQAKETLLEF